MTRSSSFESFWKMQQQQKQERKKWWTFCFGGLCLRCLHRRGGGGGSSLLRMILFWSLLSSLVYYYVFFFGGGGGVVAVVDEQKDIVVDTTTTTTTTTTRINPTIPHKVVKKNQDDPPPADDYCQYYDGVLLISQGDRNGAAGTIFYLFVLNQLLYAEKHNLQPWIHLNSYSRHIYDPTIHGSGAPPTSTTSTTYEFPHQLEATWEYYQDPLFLNGDSNNNKTFPYPGKPIPLGTSNDNGPVTITVEGTGVWNSYFESKVPITFPTTTNNPNNPQHQQSSSSTIYSSFLVDITKPCTNLPILNLHTTQQLVQGLHLFCPYCVRSWKYGGGMPPSLKLPLSYNQWWYPMRLKGQQMVHKYYHPKLIARPVQPQPPQQTKTQTPPSPSPSPSPCLAIHIRHSDKANKRVKIPIAAFLPYCEAFAKLKLAGDGFQQSSSIIYLATDSQRVIEKIQNEWPSAVVKIMKWQNHTEMIRSIDTTPVFDTEKLYYNKNNTSDNVNANAKNSDHHHHHHKTNQQVLWDIQEMSKCSWFLHGLSAVSEATIYTSNQLVQQSQQQQQQQQQRTVNLEFYTYYKRRKRNRNNNGVDNDDDDDNIDKNAPMSVEDFITMIKRTTTTTTT